MVCTSSWIVFVPFLEESKIPKRHFEINWPLVIVKTNNQKLLLVQKILLLVRYNFNNSFSIFKHFKDDMSDTALSNFILYLWWYARSSLLS